MRFAQTRDLIVRLLKARTYNDLRALESEIRARGVQIDDDFVMTEERQRALNSITDQITHRQGATVVITGWYGSGKTTVLGELLRRFESGDLKYGGKIAIDPVEIRLNEDNTISDFLNALLSGIANLADSSFVLDAYSKTRAFRDLPDSNPSSVRTLIESLVAVDVSEVDRVRGFVKDLLASYKTHQKGNRIIGLVIDELENITQPEREAEPKLAKLLQGLFESAVREFVDDAEMRAEPDAFVIFDIISRLELEQGGWLRADTLDRADQWTHDINLNRNTSNLLMRQLLRMYLDAVVVTGASGSTDDRVKKWANQLRSHTDPEDDFFTYPIVRRVHRSFTHALLAVVAATGAIQSFRAYQEGISVLLEDWDGTGSIDLPYVIDHAQALRESYGARGSGVEINRLIDEGVIVQYAKDNAQGVPAIRRRILGLLTLAAIHKANTDAVHVTVDDLQYLPEEDRPSRAVVEEVLKEVDDHQFDQWQALGDTLIVNVELILADIAEHGLEAERDWILEAIKATEGDRDRTLASLSQSLIKKLDSVVSSSILEIRTATSQPLLLGYRFSFDGARNEPKKSRDQLFIDVELDPSTSTESLPVGVRVRLPAALSALEEPATGRLVAGLTRRAGVVQPIADKFVNDVGLSPAEAFLEAIKLSMLAEADRVPPELRQPMNAYARDFNEWFLVDLGLSDKMRQMWIGHCLGFKSVWRPEEVQRLIRVLAWAQDDDLAFDARENVHDEVAVFRTNLPSSAAWAGELKKWEAEGFVAQGKLRPYDEWPRPMRDSLKMIDDLMAGSALSFPNVAQHVFGTPIHAVPAAQTTLHLLLRLGAHRLDWAVRDDVNTYKDVVVEPKSATVKQAKQRAGDKLNDALAQCVLAEVVGNQSKKTIADLLSIRSAVADATSESQVKTLLASMPPLPDTDVVDVFEMPPEFQVLDEAWTPFRQYLDYLERLGESRSDGATLIFDRLSHYAEEFASEGRYFQLSKQRAAYAKALGQPPSNERDVALVVRDFAEFVQKHGSDGREAAKELVSKFETRARLIGVETADGRKKVVDWAKAKLAAVVPVGLKSELKDSDVARMQSELEQLESEVRGHAYDLKQQLASAQQECRSLTGLTGEDERRRRQIEGALADVEPIASLLTERVTVSGSAQLPALEEAIHDWQRFNRDRIESRTELIKEWLAKHELTELSSQILASLEVIRLPLANALIEIGDLEELVDGLRHQEKDAMNRLTSVVAAAALSKVLNSSPG